MSQIRARSKKIAGSFWQNRMSSPTSEPETSKEEPSTPEVKRKPSDKSGRSLDSVLALFGAGDDTSNFVAISLLRTILDERKELREDNETVLKCWKAIPPVFLSRLLKTRPNQKRTKEEAQSMVGLAVAVIHVFTNLLPREVIEEQSFGSRADELIAVVPSSSPGTVSQISQILLALSFPSLLFSQVANSNAGSSKPSSPYLFIKMLLIDIRSTIPSLQEKLNTPEYSTSSMRIAESLDVISNFIGYLVQSLEDGDDLTEDPSSSSQLQLEPSQLLQLRTDISETMSLTIEHLRDRYDASVAGAAGLHPSARNATDPISSASRTITWQSSNMSMSEDPLTLSEIRALALWLREDDNDALRKEAAGIMDVLFGLFPESQAGGDFSSPVLIALEGILTVPEGVEAFLNEDGWDVIYQRLRKALESEEASSANQGIEIVRVLLAVVESDVTGPSKEDWMSVVSLAVEALQRKLAEDDSRVDLHIAVSQLAVELLSKAPRNVKKRYTAQASKLAHLASSKLSTADGEREEGLMEIIEGLEGLGIQS